MYKSRAVLSNALLQFKQWRRRRWLAWLDKRIPANANQQMTLNTIFVLPTGFGWALLITALCLFLLGTNYQNNLMLLLSYLVTSIMLLALFHSHRNFAQLSLVASPPTPFYCHQQGHLHIAVVPQTRLKNTGIANTRFRGRLWLSWLVEFEHTSHPVMPLEHSKHCNRRPTAVSLQRDGSAQCFISVALSYPQRGSYHLPRLTLASEFPLGLYKCWTHLDLAQRVTVYAKPVDGVAHYRNIESGETLLLDGTSLTQSADFYALTDYEQGHPLNRVAWKQVAKNGSWVVKQFASSYSDTLLLSLPSGIELEQAVSILTYHVLLLSQREVKFGLQYRTLSIAPDSGDLHCHQCLTALANFALPHSTESKIAPFTTGQGAPL